MILCLPSDNVQRVSIAQNGEETKKWRPLRKRRSAAPQTNLTHKKIPADRNDKYTLKWLTYDGLQRLTQSRRETSLSSTADDLDVCVLLEIGARSANKSLWYDELRKFRCGCEEWRWGVCKHSSSSIRWPLTTTPIDGLSLQLVDYKNCWRILKNPVTQNAVGLVEPQLTKHWLIRLCTADISEHVLLGGRLIHPC